MIDTHTHVDMPVYDIDRAEVIQRARDNGLAAFIAVGAHPESGRQTVELAQKYDFIFASVGIHPHDVKDISEREVDGVYKGLEDLARTPKVVAWGETGLDYYYEHSPRSVQRDHFRRQIQIARRLSLPLIIHSRDAGDDTIAILQEEKAGEIGGVFHCFSGDEDLARKVLDLGFYLSFSGVITFKNAGPLLPVVKDVPLDRILVETDCPYLTPTPFRGKRNEPAHVRYVVDKVAEVKGVPPEEIDRVTTQNAMDLFKGLKTTP
jgi:TatD DNase family protein